MRRRAARFVFVFLLGIIATVLGVLASLILTPPGRDLLARAVSEQLNHVVNGSISVRSISGSFLYDLTLQDVEVRDTQGVLLARVPRARVGYSITRLLAGDIVLTRLALDQPEIHIIQHHNGVMNYADILRLGQGTKGGTPPLVAFHDVRVNDGMLSIAFPWRPDTAWSRAQFDSALSAQREHPGRRIDSTPEGFRRVIELDDLTTVLSRLQISTPERKPFTLDLDSLTARVNDPGVTVTDLRGRVVIRGDSAIFSLERGALPNTEVAGGGAVTWPNDTLLFDFQLEAPRVSLNDLLWISPDFPPFTGSGTVAAKSETGLRTAYDLRQVNLRHGNQRVTGHLVALQDKARGVGFRDMDLVLSNFNLDYARAYADSLPFYGTVSGTLAGEGWLDRMRIAADWDYVDTKVPGNPVNAIVADGVVGFDKRTGLYFDNLHLRDSDIDLGTARRLAPAVVVPGRLNAVGTLNGPMRNVTFVGTARHHDGTRPVSRLEGRVHLDTRGEVLGVGLDVQLEPLSFEGIRRGFPALRSRGDVSGHLAMDGTLERMTVDADVSGDIGAIRAQGIVTMRPPQWGADGLMVRFRQLDLAALRGSGPATALNGEAVATGSMDTLRAPEGSLQLALQRSRIREWNLDTLFTNLAVRDSVIGVDTLYTEWQGARAGGSGTLGWASPHTGTMAFHLAADSLIAFDSLLLAMTKQTRDSARTFQLPLTGRATAAVTLSGHLDSLNMLGSFDARDLAFQGYRAPRLTGTFASGGGDHGRLTVAIQADTFTAQADSLPSSVWTFHELTASVEGFADSLGWAVGTGIGTGPRVDGAGWWSRRHERNVLGLDSLRADLVTRPWRLLAPATVVLSDSAPLIDSLELSAVDRSGSVRLAGRLPLDAPGEMTVDAYGLELKSLYALAGKDTTGVKGELGANIQLAGTAREPDANGGFTLSGLEFGESRLPYVEGIFNYGDKRLDANLQLWRTGTPIMHLNAHLPIYLGLGDSIPNRRLDGPVTVRAVGDSVNLAIIEAFLPAVKRVHGLMSANLAIGGTWKSPSLQGFVSLRDGGMYLPALNVTWDSISGRADFAGDSAIVENIRVTSGDGGVLSVNGSVRLQELSKPFLNLDVLARRFRAIDSRNFLARTASGRLQLDGPFYGATMTGAGVADAGVLYFADLINKQVVDLEDPSNLDLLDTLALRRRNLGEGFQSRFMDELRIQDFNLRMGSDFWLRSSEANIKLSGEVRTNKVRKEYRLDGTLEAGPGNYTLKIGPVSRDFTVQRGNVTYFGTPDLNAALDITAEHTVRAASGRDVPVIAHIGGTLRRPDLDLRSDPTEQPPLSEVDLVSYLILGVPASQARLGDQALVSNATSMLTSAISSDVERALVNDMGLPVDLIEIRPVLAGGTRELSALQLGAGWQIGPRTFLRLNAGYCSADGFAGLGASLDYRLSADWRLQTSFEPTYRTCRSLGRFDPNTAYQVGFDALWEREF
jgi:autotransporter translocation and assembly factor TamB